ncbi:MAG: hypothetical protein ACREX8_04635 [Gammaproteobacteria bacterium]
MTAKHFAPTRDVAKAPAHEFTITFVRDGREETHEFVAKPRVQFGDMMGMVQFGENNSRALSAMDRLIRRSLVDDDGTPARWAPTVDDEGCFTAPDGDRRPESELGAVEAFDAGSSRRRWAHLMDDDDDVEIELEQVAELMQWLAEQSADRPTQRSSR